ncbi:hypothetical protein TrVE_jg9195 [Triparma verrucosa]|uniref:AMP-dependent synthetase/ligase domain-containing protein n=1 Tax=Triparma verrucosa TaxID=1606542 RepID=A0A9W7CL80_9STRA|nr:hypothetical protein TrVE_jg9195 [Triparma verrucosa]
MDSRTIPYTSPQIHRSPLPPSTSHPLTPSNFDSPLESFLHHVSISPDSPCLGTRTSKTPYVYMTYKEVFENVKNLTQEFVKLESENVCTILPNCQEFHIVSLACQATGKTLVPLYPTLGPDSLLHIINEVTPSCIVAHTSLLSHLPPSSSTNFLLLSVGPNPPPTSTPLIHLTSKPSSGSITLPSLTSFHTICYTSGTTGPPKGCLITYSNIKSVLTSMLTHLPLRLDSSSKHFSYLPLPHIFERIVCEGLLSSGSSISYIRFSPNSKIQSTYLLPDLLSTQPTLFTAAPRVLEKIKSAVEKKFNNASGLMKFLLTRSLQVKNNNLINNNNPQSRLYDTLIYSKIKSNLGLSSCSLIISGSAPLLKTTYNYLKLILPDIEILEGYGLTESTGGVAVARRGRGKGGRVGSVIPGCEVRIGGEGEIEIRGGNVVYGYYDKTGSHKKITDSEGWYKTGDLGSWDSEGALKIVGRIKNTFKMQQGEFVDVEKVEGVVRGVGGIDLGVVYGDGTRNCLVCLVTVEPGLEIGEKAILESIRSNCVENKLKGFEVPKAVRIVGEFSVDNGCITPTFKVIRKGVKKVYGEVIEEMYREIEGSKKSKL